MWCEQKRTDGVVSGVRRTEKGGAFFEEWSHAICTCFVQGRDPSEANASIQNEATHEISGHDVPTPYLNVE